jgi:hypothetical protein
LLDGLPVRSHTVNTSRQVYRLRKGETIRVLTKGTGEAVYAGAAAMEGDWYRILTDDGTQCWCFSRYLQIYDAHAAPDSNDSDAVTVIAAEEIAPVFDRPWYPDTYRTLVAGGKIDLDKLNPDHNFTINRGRMMAYVELPGLSGKFAFTEIDRAAASAAAYTLVGSPLIITPRGDADLIVSYVNDRGLPISYNLVALDKDLPTVIRDEKIRRQRIYERFAKAGPTFKSAAFGTLTFDARIPSAATTGTTSTDSAEEPLSAADLTVTWTGNTALRPAFVSDDAAASGVASFKYFLSDRMRTIYDGVLTIHLEGSDWENNFFYHILDTAIQLEVAGRDAPPDNTFTGRSANPQVLLFETTGT